MQISKDSLGQPLGVIVKKEDFNISNNIIEERGWITPFSDKLEFKGLGGFRDITPLNHVVHLIVKIVMYPFKNQIGEASYSKLRLMNFATCIVPDPRKSEGNYDRVLLFTHVEKPKIIKLKVEGTQGRIIDQTELQDGNLESGKVLREGMGFNPPSEEEILKYINDKNHIFPDINHIWTLYIPSTFNLQEDLLSWFSSYDPILLRNI